MNRNFFHRAIYFTLKLRFPTPLLANTNNAPILSAEKYLNGGSPYD
ncbi:MAG: hypothetical protein IPK57_09330 [Chitinophagaceae bacterium]|nr:hypothetical protein [Chitinophagaceae bacterium]